MFLTLPDEESSPPHRQSLCISMHLRVETRQHNFVHSFELCQLAHGDQRPGIAHSSETWQNYRESVLTAFSKAFHVHTELVSVFTVRDSFNKLLMLSHSPSGGPYAGTSTSSFAVSSNCTVNSLFGFLQSYSCPHAAHHQPLMLFFFRLVLTKICECDGPSCFRPTNHMPEKFRVVPHDIFL